MAVVYLLTGGNRGDRRACMKKAFMLVEAKVGKVMKKSLLYETEPWGFSDKTYFYNQALIATTSLSPDQVLNEIHSIEREMGRRREKDQYIPRTIDIDILFYDNLIINSKELVIPHPEMEKRRFVLEPLNEIAPGVVHPVLNKAVSLLLDECEDTLEVKQIGKK